MKAAKQRYYEALERQRSGERILDRHLNVSNRLEVEETAAGEVQVEFGTMDAVYQELGMKTFHAVTNCLDWLTRLGSRDFSNPLTDRKGIAKEAMREMMERFDAIGERFDRIEARLSAIEAGIKRIDRFTLDAFREIEQIKEASSGAPLHAGSVGFRPELDRGRLAKEEAAHLALEAGMRMKSQGKRLSLAAVAREAGLKYGQIVYAFGNKDAFFKELERKMSSEAAKDETGRENGSMEEEAV